MISDAAVISIACELVAWVPFFLGSLVTMLFLFKRLFSLFKILTSCRSYSPAFEKYDSLMVKKQNLLSQNLKASEATLRHL